MTARTVAIVPNVAAISHAHRAGRRRADPPCPNAAILDVQLLDGVSLPIAERLTALRVPFVVLSAHAAALDQPELAAAPRLGKPARHDLLRQALIATLDSQVLGAVRPAGTA